MIRPGLRCNANISTDFKAHFSNIWSFCKSDLAYCSMTDLRLVVTDPSNQLPCPIRVHQAILLPMCPIFRSLVQDQPDSEPVVLLPGVTLPVLQCLLTLVYTGESVLTSDCTRDDLINLMKSIGMSINNIDKGDIVDMVRDDSQEVTPEEVVNDVFKDQAVDVEYPSTLVNYARSFGHFSGTSDLSRQQTFSSRIQQQKMKLTKKKPNICGQIASSDKIEIHQGTATAIINLVTPMKDYFCPDCDNTFSTQAKLYYHVAVHHNESVVNNLEFEMEELCSEKQANVSGKHELEETSSELNQFSMEMLECEVKEESENHCGMQLPPGNDSINEVNKDGSSQSHGLICNVCGKKHTVIGNNQHYSCDVCKQMFHIKKNMRKHMKLIHGISMAKAVTKKEQCTICLKEHDIIPGLTEHFSCHSCNSKFHEKKNLQRHIRSSHGVAPESKKLNIENDSGKKHTKVGTNQHYSCEVCKKIRTKKNMRKHMKMMHGISMAKAVTKKEQCTICLKEHTIIPGLTEHFSCHSCDSKFYKKKNLLRHIRSSHGVAPESKKLNVEYDSGNENHCHTCQKAFQTRNYLLYHTDTNHVLEKLDHFSCRFCGYKVKTQHKHILLEHLRTHTDERPEICRFCGKGFKQRKTLINHERLHTGEKPHKCEYCFQAFAQRTSLVSHIKWNHENDKNKA